MNNTRKLCFSAVMIAVGILLPMAFHMIPNGGSIFAPMHLPVFCAGFICGPYYGAIVGLICPLLSSLFTGMPAVAYLPNMMVELFVYGVSSGVLFCLIKTKKFMLDVFITLILSMLIGRFCGGLVAYFLFLGGRREIYSWTIFFTTYFVTCWPAIVIQIFVIPAVVTVAKKARFLSEGDRYLSAAHRKKNIEKQREFFDSIAENWRDDSNLDREAVAELFCGITFREGERVLDVGCGTGVLDEYFTKCGCTVDAIDVSGKMICKAKENPANDGVNYLIADFYEYPFFQKYDKIVVFDAYPHFLDKERFARKAYDLLNDGGMLYIMFDESRGKINGYHADCSNISVDLLPVKKEAEVFMRLFDVISMRDDERYTLQLRKKLSKKG